LGQKQTFGRALDMSALPPKADISSVFYRPQRPERPQPQISPYNTPTACRTDQL
jgi:hypothetical protein